MANNGLGKEAIQEITALFNELNRALDITAQKLGVIRKGANMPSSFVKNAKEASEAQNNLANSGEKLNKTIKAKIPTLTQLQALRKKEAILLEKANSLYSKADTKLQKLKKEYKELAIQQQLKGRLDEKEAKRAEFLSQKITKYDTALKNVDAKMGVYTRSVGSYGKAFDSLGFSVAQITRESPAFLNSLNTGFMAISNNIPILVDEINKLKIANVQLAKDGQPTVSIMKQLGKAIFSWQSLISAGIVALTVLGPKLIEFVQSLFKSVDALEKQSDALRKLDDSAKESIGTLVILSEKAQQLNLTNSERAAIMEQINDQYDDLLGNLDNEEDALIRLRTVVEDYINSLVQEEILKQAQLDLGEQVVSAAEAEIEAKEFLQELEEKKLQIDDKKVRRLAELNDLEERGLMSLEDKNKILEQENINILTLDGNERKYLDLLEKADSQRRAALKLGKSYANQLEIENEVLDGTIDSYQKRIDKNEDYIRSGRDGVALTKDEISVLQLENDELQKNIDLLLGKKEARDRLNDASSLGALENQIKILKNEINTLEFGSAAYESKSFALKLLQTVYDGLTKKVTKNTKAFKRERVEALNLEAEGVSSIVFEMQKQINFFEKVNSLYADGTKEAKFYTAQITKLKVALGEISALSKEFTDAIGSPEVGAEGIKAAQAWANAFQANEGGEEDDDDKLGWVSYFNTLVPLAENAFRIIGQLQKSATDKALADLEKQKDLAIKFAGESTSAREAVEEQYQEKRSEIQRKAAENEKRQAIFSTTLNIAQAVVNALTAKPFSLGLAVAVGAIGAAQLALVASTPIPEFAEGVRDFGGGLAIVGDGGRSEVIRTPDGKVMKTPSKDTLVNLPKGSDVFSSEDEFNRELTKMLNMSMINNHQPLISKPELTKEDLSDVISRLEDTIRNKESIEIIEDERGKRVYKKRLNARTEILNNRRRIQGRGI